MVIVPFQGDIAQFRKVIRTELLTGRLLPVVFLDQTRYDYQL